MKNIKELELLVNFAKSLGQTPDPKMVEQIREHYELQKNIIESVKANSAKDIDEAFGYINNRENKDELVQAQTETEGNPKEQSSFSSELSLAENYERHEEESDAGDTGGKSNKQTLADLAAKFISEAPKKDSFQQPDVPLVPGDMKAVKEKLRFLENWLSKVTTAGPGSGETKLRFLDDVDRNTIADKRYLRYDAASGKFIFDVGHVNNFHGAFQSNVIQRANTGNVENIISYNVTDFSEGVRLESNTKIVSRYPGNYNLQYSIQLENAGAQIADVNIWLKKNGNVITNTNSKYNVLGKHAGANGAIIAAINYFYETTIANEYVELAWWTKHWDDTFISTIPELTAIPGVQPAVPETPSVILTVSPVSIKLY